MKKGLYILGGLSIALGAAYFFMPRFGHASRYDEWKNRNVPRKTVAGGKLEYGANSDHPTVKIPIPVATNLRKCNADAKAISSGIVSGFMMADSLGVCSQSNVKSL